MKGHSLPISLGKDLGELIPSHQPLSESVTCSHCFPPRFETHPAGSVVYYRWKLIVTSLWGLWTWS